MELENVSNYPVTVNGVRIEAGETEDVEIEDLERYKDDRRFLLEDDYNQPESEDEDEGEPEGESDDKLETSNPEEQKTEEGDE